ncbi:MAG: hypothetical protein ACOC0W_03985, partial [Desulfosalsimonas sp.]
MILFRATIEFIAWLLKVIFAFIRVRPLTTIAVILMSASSNVLNVLAFLMPLKVIMLAATPGVPGKLSFLVSPEHKEIWIYTLTAASIVSYFLMILFDSLTDKLSLAGSRHLLDKTEAIPLFENQGTLAQSYYSSFSQVSAGIIFAGMAFLAISFIYFQFFAFLTGAIVFLFLVSCTLVRSPEKSVPGTVSYYLRENYNSYLSVLSSLFFLGAFVFLLIPFLFYESTDFIVAIVSFIILRRSLSTIKSSIKNSVKLASQKHRINALIFPNVQLQEKQKPEELAFFEFFNKEARKKHAAEALEQTAPLDSQIDVMWEDSVIPGVNTFAIVAGNGSSGNTTCFRQNVFPLKQTMKIENEEFLFTHIPRHHLKAPEMITLYYAGQFQCQILEYGENGPPGNGQWQEMEDMLLEHIWSYPPPHDLVRACCASAPMLYDRLSPEFISKLEIGADTNEEINALQAFIDGLPAVRSRLEQLPMHIYNPDLKKNNISLSKNQEPYIMFWGRWSLEPIGAGLPPRLKKNGLAEIMEKLRAKRKDLPSDYSEKDVFLAADCWDLENFIKKNKYKSA